jgi:RimJ/RimL family protein N-acetyltransferase
MTRRRHCFRHTVEQNDRVRTLETDRLELRAWRADDADALFDIYSRWEVARYLGSTPRVMESREQAQRAAERWGAMDEDPYGVWAVVPQGAGVPVGSVLLKELPLSGDTEPLPPSGDVEVGWHLHPDAWGHGYATEAAGRVLAHGFASGLTEIFAITYPQNAPSQAVCRRLGMEHLGSTDRYYNVTSELFRIRAPQDGS